MGWLGHRNLGDEAMFEAIRQLMRPCRPVPYGSEARETAFRRLGLSGHRFFHIVLSGGGTLVNPGIWPPVRILASEDTPMAMFGTGVGRSGFGQAPAVPLEFWSTIAHKFFAVGVRGPDSRQQLLRLGFKNVEIIGDPALSLAVDVLPPTPVKPARLIVNLAGEPHAEFLEELAGFLAHTAGNGVLLVGARLSAQDTCVFDRSFAVAGAPRFEVVQTDRDRWQYMRLVSGARAVLAVRLRGRYAPAAVFLPCQVQGFHGLDGARRLPVALEPGGLRTAARTVGCGRKRFRRSAQKHFRAGPCVALCAGPFCEEDSSGTPRERARPTNGSSPRTVNWT